VGEKESGYHGFSRGVIYLVQYISALFSFPVVPHKPVLLHQKCPDEYYAVRQARLYLVLIISNDAVFSTGLGYRTDDLTSLRVQNWCKFPVLPSEIS